MTDNKDLLNKLSDMLDSVSNKKLKDQGKMICDKELVRIRGAINFAASSLPSGDTQKLFSRRGEVFKDIYETLKSVSKKIEAEGRVLNTELHGVENYSAYELKRIEVFTYKNDLRRAIDRMIKQIRDESPLQYTKSVRTRR